MGNVLYLLGLKSRYKLLTKEIIDLMNITPYNKLILQQRYVNLMEKLDIKRNSTNLWYNILTLVITLGSILVPALISIKDIPMYYSDNNLYINVSSDDSIEVVQYFNDRTDINLQNVTNYRPGQSINLGVKQASKDYILILLRIP